MGDPFYAYEVKINDTLDKIALKFYGTTKATDALASYNHIENKHFIRVGDKIKIPVRLPCLLSSSLKLTIPDGKSSFDWPEGGIPVEYKHCVPSVQFVFKGKVAARRFIYYWMKDEGEWINMGVFMTDNLGMPRNINLYLMTHPQPSIDISNIGADTVLPSFFSAAEFGFYTPKQTEEFCFLTTGTNNGFISQDKTPNEYYIYFKLDTEYAFMFAPLDSIWAKNGFYRLDTYKDITKYQHPPEFWTDEKMDVDTLIAKKLAVKITLAEPAVNSLLDLKMKSTQIDMPATLQEYVSLLRKYTYQLSEGLSEELKAKNEVMKIAGGLNELSYVLALMDNHHLGDYPWEKPGSTRENLVQGYQKLLKECSDYLEENFIEKPLQINTGLYRAVKVEPMDYEDPVSKFIRRDVLNIPDPEIYLPLRDWEKERLQKLHPELQDFEPVTQRADKIAAILKDSDFRNKLYTYLQELSAKDFNNYRNDYFSFFHPYMTIIEALHDAYLVIALIPDNEYLTQFYKALLEPMENDCIKAFNDSATTVKDTIFNKLLMQVIGKGDDKLLNLDPEDMELVKQSFYGVNDTPLATPVNASSNPLSIFFAFCTDSKVKQLPNIWNTTEGAPCYLESILIAFNKIRVGLAMLKPQRTQTIVLVSQFKLYMVYNVYYTTTQGALFYGKMEIICDYYLALVYRKTMKRPPVRSIDLEGLQVKKPFVIANKISCGFQIFLSLLAIKEFAESEGTKDDWLRLLNATANAGIALTGLGEKFWNKILRNAKFFTKVRIGTGLTVVTSATDIYFSSVEAMSYYRYGDRFNTCLSVFNVCVAVVSMVYWLIVFIIGAVSNPIGWILIIATLITFLVRELYEFCKSGLQKYLDKMIRIIDEYAKDFITGTNVYSRHRFLNIPAKTYIDENNFFIYQTDDKILVSHHFCFRPDAAKMQTFFSRDSRLLKVNDNKVLPLMPLDHQITTEKLATRGWEEQDVIDIHTGHFYGADMWLMLISPLAPLVSRGIRDGKIEKEIKELYKNWERLNKSELATDIETKFINRLKSYGIE